EHALVRVDLRGTLRRGGKRTQRRREPFAKITPVSLVERPVDRTLGLRIGSREIEQDLFRCLGHRQAQCVETRLVHTIRFDVILEMINTVPDLRQDLAPKYLGGVLENLLEGHLQRLYAVPGCERLDTPAAEPGRALLGVKVALEMLRKPRIAHDDAECRFIALAPLIKLDRRNKDAFHPAIGGVDRQASGNRSADIVMVAEHLAETDQAVVEKNRDGGAQIGDMSEI